MSSYEYAGTMPVVANDPTGRKCIVAPGKGTLYTSGPVAKVDEFFAGPTTATAPTTAPTTGPATTSAPAAGEATAMFNSWKTRLPKFTVRTGARPFKNWDLSRIKGLGEAKITHGKLVGVAFPFFYVKKLCDTAPDKKSCHLRVTEVGTILDYDKEGTKKGDFLHFKEYPNGGTRKFLPLPRAQWSKVGGITFDRAVLVFDGPVMTQARGPLGELRYPINECYRIHEITDRTSKTPNKAIFKETVKFRLWVNRHTNEAKGAAGFRDVPDRLLRRARKVLGRRFKF
jgi:hypothetical protein